jgi:phosphonate transport system ATP-binding protein
VIEVRNLTKRYGDFEALHDVSLTAAKGEFLVILGASGAGKSTLLRCINHLAVPTAGEIRVDGELSRGDRSGLRALAT